MMRLLHIICCFALMILFIDHAYAGDEVNVNDSYITYTLRTGGELIAGTIKLSDGELQLENDFITGCKLIFDMKSLSVDNYHGSEKSYMEKRLQGQDFFDAKAYRNAILEFKSIRPTFSTSGNSIIIADLTIKGVTKEVEFRANLLYQSDVAMGAGRITINIGDWNIFAAGTPSGRTLKNESNSNTPNTSNSNANTYGNSGTNSDVDENSDGFFSLVFRVTSNSILPDMFNANEDIDPDGDGK